MLIAKQPEVMMASAGNPSTDNQNLIQLI